MLALIRFPFAVAGQLIDIAVQMRAHNRMVAALHTPDSAHLTPRGASNGPAGPNSPGLAGSPDPFTVETAAELESRWRARAVLHESRGQAEVAYQLRFAADELASITTR